MLAKEGYPVLLTPPTPIVLCATSYLLSVTNQQGNSYWLLLIDSVKLSCCDRWCVNPFSYYNP